PVRPPEGAANPCSRRAPRARTGGPPQPTERRRGSRLDRSKRLLTPWAPATRGPRRMKWRLWLMLSHRWMGIAIGLVVVAWTLSGLVLVHYGLPSLPARERLGRLPPLDPDAISISPAEAAALVDGEPFRMRLSMLGHR